MPSNLYKASLLPIVSLITCINAIDDSFQIAPLILVVFIENAFKHAQSAQSKGIKIEIELNVNQHGVLHFRCINTHAPTHQVEDLNSGGIGLQNVKKRLNHIYPNLHRLVFDETEGSYVVDLELQLNKSIV